LQLKEDLINKESSLFQAQSMINELKKELQQAREEVIDAFTFLKKKSIFMFCLQMLTLEETVQKECKESKKLKDALIETRQQLIAMKKNGTTF